MMPVIMHNKKNHRTIFSENDDIQESPPVEKLKVQKQCGQGADYRHNFLKKNIIYLLWNKSASL